MLAIRMARHLRRSYRVIFACLDELGSLADQLRSEGFSVYALHRRPGVDWRCGLQLGRWLRGQRVDLIHAHQYSPFFYALLARWVYRLPPILFMEHGRPYPDYPRARRILANRLLLESRDRVVAVGEAVRQALIVNEGLPADRISVIHNGVDLKPFLLGSFNRDTVRRAIGIGDNDFVILQVARLDPIKDHETAFRALGRVLQVRPDARLVVAGDGPERPWLEALIQNHQLNANVRLLGTRTDVAQLMSAADVLLLSSISEGIPLTLIEAMAAGLPVVSTDVGGVAEVVDDGVTGLLAPAGDADALARQVLRLANSPALRINLAQAARTRAIEKFAEERMIRSYEVLYREMLGI